MCTKLIEIANDEKTYILKAQTKTINFYWKKIEELVKFIYHSNEGCSKGQQLMTKMHVLTFHLPENFETKQSKNEMSEREGGRDRETPEVTISGISKGGQKQTYPHRTYFPTQKLSKTKNKKSPYPLEKQSV